LIFSGFHPSEASSPHELTFIPVRQCILDGLPNVIRAIRGRQFAKRPQGDTEFMGGKCSLSPARRRSAFWSHLFGAEFFEALEFASSPAEM
jgi:hypothetical protein